jgi:hypothetical protein
LAWKIWGEGDIEVNQILYEPGAGVFNIFHFQSMNKGIYIRNMVVLISLAVLFGLLAGIGAIFLDQNNTLLNRFINNATDYFVFLLIAGFLASLVFHIARLFLSTAISGVLFWVGAYLIAEICNLGFVLARIHSPLDFAARILFFNFFLALYVFVCRGINPKAEQIPSPRRN